MSAINIRNTGEFMIYPRIAPQNKLRVWVGVFFENMDAVGDHHLKWELDHQTAQAPTALRPMSLIWQPEPEESDSKRFETDDAIPGGYGPGFAGVYEFDGLEPDTEHTIKVTLCDDSATEKAWAQTVVRTLPDEIPRDSGDWFNVLLFSCYYRDHDQGLRDIVADKLTGDRKPHVTLLMGDQVYLDRYSEWQTLFFENTYTWMAGKFQHDYKLNWQPGPQSLSEVLSIAPSVALPDDHEYWNNFPHACPWMHNTISEEGRTHWQRAAQDLYDGFQFPYAAGTSQTIEDQRGDPFVFHVPPLSFFLADGRTQRDVDGQYTMKASALNALEDWATYVKDNDLVGIFVTGQLMFRETEGGALSDWEMPHYQDYNNIVKHLATLIDAGRPILHLSGDVHWGRVCEAIDTHDHNRVAIREVICSPAAVVDASILEPLQTVMGYVFNDDWPHHSNADPPPDYFARSYFAKHGDTPNGERIKINKPTHTQVGNHIALLSFRRMQGKLEIRISYYPIHKDAEVREKYTPDDIYFVEDRI